MGYRNNKSNTIALTSLLVLSLQLLSLGGAWATTYTYNFGGPWEYPGNWSPSAPPNPLPNGDAIIIASACTLETDFTLSAGSSLTINSGQSLFLTSATLANNGSINVNGDLSADAFGTFNNNGVVNNNGSMYFNGLFSNAGLFAIYGYCGFYSDLSISNSGTIQIKSGGTFRLDSPTLSFGNNNGSLFEINSGGSLINSATFINNGTVKLDGNLVNGDEGNGPGTFNNIGTLKGTGTFEQMMGTFNNLSTGIIAPGTGPGILTVSGNFDLGSGTYTVEIDGIGQGTEYDLLAVDGTATIGSSSKLNIVFGYTPTVGESFDILMATSVNGSFTYPTNVTFSGGDVGTISVTTYPDDNSVRVQVLSLTSEPITYTFTGDGDWDVTGNWDSNGIPPSTLTDGDTIIINPSGFCQLTTNLIIEEGGTFTINPSKDFRTGNFDITNGGTFNMLGDINSDGGFDLINNSTGMINKNGTIFVNGSLHNEGSIIDSGGTWFITGIGAINDGTMQLNGSSAIFIYVGRFFDNSGIIEISSSSSINNSGTFINNSTLQIDGTFNNGSIFNPGTFGNNGILKGTGTIKQTGTFTNNGAGSIEPGLSPGTLTVSGDFDFGSGTYYVEINGTGQGTDYDWIDVSGTATIGPDSKLHIVFGNGYTPTVGTTFDILTASTVDGTFDPANITISGGGVGSVDVTYAGGNMMQLEVASVLPVALVSFTAKEQNNKVLLHWETASEQNNKGFEVQRSSNGHSWETLDFVSGNGTAFESHTYIFMDKSPLRGTNYYRLRQLDYDNKEEYSPIKTVKLNGDGGISIYPNPATSGVTLLLNTASYAGEAQLTIYNAFGKQISTRLLILNNADSHLNLDLSGLQAGIYMLDIKAGDKRWNERLIIK